MSDDCAACDAAGAPRLARKEPVRRRVMVAKCQIYEKWQMTRTWRPAFSGVDAFSLGLWSRRVAEGGRCCRRISVSVCSNGPGTLEEL